MNRPGDAQRSQHLTLTRKQNSCHDASHQKHTFSAAFVATKRQEEDKKCRTHLPPDGQPDGCPIHARAGERLLWETLLGQQLPGCLNFALRQHKHALHGCQLRWGAHTLRGCRGAQNLAERLHLGKQIASESSAQVCAPTGSVTRCKVRGGERASSRRRATVRPAELQCQGRGF